MDNANSVDHSFVDEFEIVFIGKRASYGDEHNVVESCEGNA